MVGLYGQYLPSLERKVQPLILSRVGIVCIMKSSLVWGEVRNASNLNGKLTIFLKG